MGAENKDHLRTSLPSIEYKEIDDFLQDDKFLSIKTKKLYVHAEIRDSVKGYDEDIDSMILKGGLGYHVEDALACLEDAIKEKRSVIVNTQYKNGPHIVDRHLRDREVIIAYKGKQPHVRREAGQKMWYLNSNPSFTLVYGAFKESIRRL